MSDKDTRRTPPHSREAEEACIGACLLEGGAIDRVFDVVSTADFYFEAHRKIAAAIAAMREEGTAVDLLTLSDCLRDRGVLEDIGGASHLHEISERVPTAANVGYYAAQVRRDAQRREVIQRGTEMVMRVYEDGRALDDLPGLVLPLLDGAGRRLAAAPITEQVIDAVSASEARAEGRGSNLVPTGFLEIDQLMAGGWMPGNFTLIAGRTSMGKSSFAESSAIAALQRRVPTGIVSIEQKARLVVYRLLAKLGGIKLQHMIAGRCSPAERLHMNAAAEQLATLPLQIRDGVKDWPQIQVAARRMVANGARLVIIDHFGLINMPGRELPATKMRELTQQLKALAEDLDVPLLVLCQINREAAKDKRDNRPRLHHLRDAGTLEQDADDVILLHRPGYYDKSEDLTLCEAEIAKQRNGPCATVKLKFHAENALFTDWTDEQPTLFDN